MKMKEGLKEFQKQKVKKEENKRMGNFYWWLSKIIPSRKISLWFFRKAVRRGFDVCTIDLTKLQ